MNYKVMQRPMFRMGGKAASQGTGITSGLDERVELKDAGFLGTGMSQTDFSNLTPQQLITLQAGMADKGTNQLNDMRDIVRLQALSNLAGNVLPNIERGGLEGVVDFFRDPATTQTALAGLTGLKQVDIAGSKMKRENLNNLIQAQMGFKMNERAFNLQQEKFDFTKEEALKAGERADKKLEIEEKRALVKSATQIKLDASNKAREILQNEGVTSGLEIKDPLLKQEYFSLSSLAGDTISQANARKLAINAVLRQQEEQNSQRVEQGLSPKDFTPEIFNSKVDFLTLQFLQGAFTGNAMGGTPTRVDRAMGTPMMGEQPQQMTEQQDVAMETQGQGNNVYAMLRARLPQEVSDEVVKLISYNKEAFADFASIKNQEDVSSFNEKYGVQLVIDVATV
jgi:hypothetical protein